MLLVHAGASSPTSFTQLTLCLDLLYLGLNVE
jgi:hypothetical protein